MASPKIAVIGAGSYFFGRPVIWHTAHSEVLRGGTLALVDTDAKVLGTMMKLARRVIDEAGSPTELVGSTDRREVLADADFVVLTFSDRNAHFRGLDCEVSERYGVRMCSGDTIGPGGIFRALRETPRALDVARDVAELAPGAWVVNFINPTAVLGIALMRHSDVRSFALCDGHHEPAWRLRVLKEAGILGEDARSVPPEVERRLDLAVGGVNHCTWMVRLGYDGRDYLPAWRERLAARAAAEGADSHSKARYNDVYALQLMDIYGAYPTAIGHTKEYVPFFQGRGVLDAEPEPITVFDAPRRAEEMARAWKQTEDLAEGREPLSEFPAGSRSDHATDIIESMWGGLGRPFYINGPNRGAVSNMAPDAFIELRCDVDMRGPRPQPFGEFPRGLLGLQQQVLDTHELTALAAVTCDRDVLLRALVTDPIVNSIADARGIMEELLERERDALPSGWYR